MREITKRDIRDMKWSVMLLLAFVVFQLVLLVSSGKARRQCEIEREVDSSRWPECKKKGGPDGD